MHFFDMLLAVLLLPVNVDVFEYSKILEKIQKLKFLICFMVSLKCSLLEQIIVPAYLLRYVIDIVNCIINCSSEEMTKLFRKRAYQLVFL